MIAIRAIMTDYRALIQLTAGHRAGRMPQGHTGQATSRRTIYLGFFILPFLMLAWLCPFAGSKTIGFDYTVYSPMAQLDLMWSAWNGTFPLYMPGFAYGHSTAAMTLGQLYHPLSWLSSMMPGYWHGAAIEWNTFFHLISLGFVQLIVFHLCRRLAMTPFMAFFTSIPVIYNLRMLDSLRYGASMEGYTGMLLSAAAAAFVYLDPTSKRKIAFLGLSTYLLAVSGHPQWAFLGMTGAGLFAVLFPWLAFAIQPDSGQPTVNRLFVYARRLALGFGTGVLLAAPYLLTFYVEYFKTNASRTDNRYEWTLAYADSIRGEFANFLFPLHADVHGAFGGSALFLVAALFPLVRLVLRPPKILWISYSLGLLAFLYALGNETSVHAFIVTHIPVFGSFRVPGRLVLWIPLFAFPIWAWLLREENRKALFFNCSVAFSLFVVLIPCKLDSLPIKETHSPHTILLALIPPQADSLIFYMSGATLLFLLCAATYGRLFRAAMGLALCATLASTWLCLRHGTWEMDRGESRTFKELSYARKNSVNSHADPGYGMEMHAVSEYKKFNLNPTRHLGTIEHHATFVESDDLAYVQLRSKSKRPQALIINHPIEPMANRTDLPHDSVRLRYNTSNRFIFDVVAAADGYFVLGQPWLPGFTATLDGVSVAVSKANVLFPAIFLPQGRHSVEFSFRSTPFLVGVGLAFLTLWGWVAYVFSDHRKQVAVFGITLAIALAVLLHAWLYRGPSFGTAYEWDSSQPSSENRKSFQKLINRTKINTKPDASTIEMESHEAP
jgi:hypothetical protein